MVNTPSCTSPPASKAILPAPPLVAGFRQHRQLPGRVRLTGLQRVPGQRRAQLLVVGDNQCAKVRRTPVFAEHEVV